MQQRALVLLFFLFVAVITSPAQSTSDKSLPAPDFSKEAFVVEHLATAITVAEDGSSTRQVDARVHILADAGVKAFAVINFTYTSSNQVVDVDYVRVRKHDGTVIPTPEYNIQEMPADVTRTAPMYSDIREKHVAVKALGVGDSLEYSVRIRTLKSEIPGQFWCEHSFSRQQIIQDETLELSIPKAKHLIVKSPDFKPAVREDSGRTIYLWKHSNLVRREPDESSNPLRGTPPPSVLVSTFSDWQEIGKWYAGLQGSQAVVTPAIKAKADQLTLGLTSDDEKLRAIYTFVSVRIHYIGLDFGIGRYQPHSADDVLSNEYGDCKDKHTLLAALLKAAGFDAWPALIHISQNLDSDVPSLAQFNHVITVVPRKGGLDWIDTTPEVAPYGLLIRVIRGKQALVMPTGKSPLLMTTPADPPFPQEQRFVATAKLGADGVLKGHIKLTYHGDSEVAIRMAVRQLSESQWKEGVQRLSRALGFGGEVSEVKISAVEDLSRPIDISYDYTRKDYSDWEHKQILSLLPPMGIESLGNRNDAPKEPEYLGAKGEIYYHSEIELPPGSTIVPRLDLNIVEPYAEYHTINLVDHGVLKSTRRLVIKQVEVPVAQWGSLRKMSKAASDDAFSFLPLGGLSGKDSAVAGNYGGKADDAASLEKTRELLKDDPGNAALILRLARLLVKTGKTDEAAEELQLALKLLPDNVDLHEALGGVLLRAGKPEEAVQHFHTAAEGMQKLHPDDFYVRLNNIAYSLSEAGVGLDLAKTCIEQALAQLELSAGKPELELSERYKFTNEFATLWDTAGWVYFKLGDLKSAQSYLRSAWLLSQNAIVGDHLGQVLEKLGKTTDAEHTYHLAYYASQASSDLKQKISARYQKLAGKPMDTKLASVRLPNGKWTMTPPEELSRMRTTTLAPKSGPDNSAIFEITMTPGQPLSVSFSGGNEEMKKLQKDVAAAKFQVEFPENSHATLHLFATLFCGKISGCAATLLPMQTTP
jgi:tetratricopeptide (TPR) repeat protein